MDLISLLYKSVTGNNESGILGKIKQHRGKYNNQSAITDAPSPIDAFPAEFIVKLDDMPTIKYRGSIGFIYISHYKTHKIAIKHVPTNIKNNLQSDIRASNIFGKLSSIINPSANQMITEITKTVSKELEMKLELSWCIELSKYQPTFQNYNCKLLQAIPELSTNDNFVYLFDKGKSLSSIKEIPIEKRNDIAKRIALVYFTFIHKHNILFGDLNEGNFLYDSEGDWITFIDYGCIINLDQIQMKHLQDLHKSQRSIDTLSELILSWGGNQNMARFVYQQSQPFWDKSKKFSDVPELFEFLKNPINAMSQMPPEISMVIRASHQLNNLMKYLDADFTIANELNQFM